MDDNVARDLILYDEIRQIIETHERTKEAKYRECLENNWISEYTDYAINNKLQAVEEIRELTKDQLT